MWEESVGQGYADVEGVESLYLAAEIRPGLCGVNVCVGSVCGRRGGERKEEEESGGSGYTMKEISPRDDFFAGIKGWRREIAMHYHTLLSLQT